MSTSTQLMTAEELLRLPRGQYRYELISGELKTMSPSSHNHAIIAANLIGPMHRHVRKNKLGTVYSSEGGFLLTQNPDTVRAPDVAFIRQERLDAAGPVKSYWIGPPDLAVEVMSPSDSVSKVSSKVSEWLDAGTCMVWVVNPKHRTVMSYRSLNDVATFDELKTLSGSDVIPGFEIRVDALFEGLVI